MENETNVSLENIVESAIYVIRGKRIMLDYDLAKLYHVSTKVFNQAVKRNMARFPVDFLFRLTLLETTMIRSQIVTGSHRNQRYRPYAFTQEGVAMLSGVLRSLQAVDVNIAIMRGFVRMRRMLSGDQALAEKLMALDRRLAYHDEQIGEIIDAIRNLMQPTEKLIPKIGYKP